jgi:protoporphyrinogen oxidase
MSSDKPRIYVIGAGVAGLSAALHLARKGLTNVEVVERTGQVGGLATSYKLGPVTFDFGPHAFHSQEPRIIQFFQDIMSGKYREIDKNVAINFQNRLYPYPLNPLKALRHMPLSASWRCGMSYLWTLFTDHRGPAKLISAEDFFVHNFGWELYRIFFEGYTQKVWGIHPRELSVEFIRNRLPSASLIRIVYAALTGRDLKTQKPNEVPLKLRIFYPKAGSIEFPKTMADHLIGLGGRISLNWALESVQLEGGRVRDVTLSRGNELRKEACEALISTIPLPELLSALHPAPPAEILQAARELTFRPILIACLWINRPSLFPYQTLYYTQRVFNRLAQMNSYSVDTVPAGTCGITAEMTCSVNDALWQMDEKALVQKVVADMVDEHLIQAKDVLDAMILRHQHGYPIYKKGFEPYLEQARQAIKAIPNLYVSGRQGMFNYAQMHYGVSAGMAMAEHIAGGLPKSNSTNLGSEDQLFA